MAGNPPILSSSASIFQPGEILSGMYEIRCELGAGGMGQVFEAHDLSLNRRVAIKAPWPDLHESVKKEAQALAAIRHPSMVSVYAMGLHRGIEYVVMERLYGVGLDAYLYRRRSCGDLLQISEVVELLIAISDGLMAVHRAGITHRDIKPSNIMMAPGNRVVLMDFGLFLPEFDVIKQTTVAGSPQYMAPEAISNEVQLGAGHLVDLYALGILAYEMLVGEVPFNSEEILEIWEKHLLAQIPDVRKLRPDTPPKLALLIQTLLAKEPTERSQSAEAVLWQLRSIQAAFLREAERVKPSSTIVQQSSGLQLFPKETIVDGAGTFSVLIVDDDKQLQKVLSFYVKKAAPDAEIRVAGDGDAAIEALKEKVPHLLLLDLHMPKTNGIEVAMYLRGSGVGSTTQIVSVSAGVQEHDIQLLQQLGITRFITKGLQFQENVLKMIGEVKSILGRG